MSESKQVFNIEEVDRHLAVNSTVTEPDLVWYNVRKTPFAVHGLLYDEEMGHFLRIPQSVADTVSPGVAGGLNRHTAGGRVRFRTNSRFIAIHAVMANTKPMSHMPLTGQSGFDLYHTVEDKEIYYKTFVPPRGMTEGYDCGQAVDGVLTDYTIHFPLYDNVKELYIGLKKDAVVESATSYRHTVPIVYYGNSVTQGGCASRPGNSYQAILTRRLSADHINLGYSGNGKGEPQFAAYIATLPMSVFVMDYDGNAPSEEYLRATHEPFYRIVREKNPTLPIVMLSGSSILLMGDAPTWRGRMTARREIIRETYQHALAAGDKNVYFVDGAEIFAGADWDACTVDGSHPNDLGFFRYADCLEKYLRPLLS